MTEEDKQAALRDALLGSFSVNGRAVIEELFPVIIRFAHKPPYNPEDQELFIQTAFQQLDRGQLFIRAVVLWWNIVKKPDAVEGFPYTGDEMLSAMEAECNAAGIVDPPEALLSMLSDGLLSLSVDIDLADACHDGICGCMADGRDRHWWEVSSDALPGIIRRVIQPLTADSITGCTELRIVLERNGINPGF